MLRIIILIIYVIRFDLAIVVIQTSFLVVINQVTNVCINKEIFVTKIFVFLTLLVQYGYIYKRAIIVLTINEFSTVKMQKHC